MNWAMNAPESLQKEAQRYDRELMRPVGGERAAPQAMVDALETMRLAREKLTPP